MAARKTIPVQRVKDLVNARLANDDASLSERISLSAMLGIVLEETGNYHGFSYLQSEWRTLQFVTTETGDTSFLRPGEGYDRPEVLQREIEATQRAASQSQAAGLGDEVEAYMRRLEDLRTWRDDYRRYYY